MGVYLKRPFSIGIYLKRPFFADSFHCGCERRADWVEGSERERLLSTASPLVSRSVIFRLGELVLFGFYG